MKDVSPLDEDFRLWALLSQTAHVMTKVRQKELDRYGISVREAGIMFAILAIGERATPAEITRAVLREPHTVTEILKRMEKEGLVTRTKDLERKNMVRVAVTDKGRQAYQQSTKRKSIYKVMSSLSQEERRQLMTSLEKLARKALKELGMQQKPRLP